MARFSKEKKRNGHRLWLHHKSPKRVSVYVAKSSARERRLILSVVEPLEISARHGIEPSLELLYQVDQLGEFLKDKLRQHGLLKGKGSCLTIGEFGTPWVEGRKDLGDKRANDYLATIEMLKTFLKGDSALRAVTPGDASAFRAHLVDQGLALDTIGWRIKMAKCLFTAAVDFAHLAINPFEKVRAGSKSINDRFVYVEPRIIEAIIEDVSCLEWKAIITLWRYGGLRAQEPLHLKWNDVDWANRRLMVQDVKRKRQRAIPLWPKVEEALSVLFAAAEEGATRIITKYKPGQKLGTQFARIIRQAGFEVWGKPIQNLRASCQNDLENAGHRITAVCNWIGNSPTVASKHYLQVTDEDFEQALGASNRGQQSVRQSVQYRTERSRTGSLKDFTDSQCTTIPDYAGGCVDPKTIKYPLKDSNLCF